MLFLHSAYVYVRVFNPASLAPNAMASFPFVLAAPSVSWFFWTFSSLPFLTLYLFTVFIYHLQVTLDIVPPTLILSPP